MLQVGHDLSVKLPLLRQQSQIAVVWHWQRTYSCWASSSSQNIQCCILGALRSLIIVYKQLFFPLQQIPNYQNCQYLYNIEMSIRKNNRIVSQRTQQISNMLSPFPFGQSSQLFGNLPLPSGEKDTAGTRAGKGREPSREEDGGGEKKRQLGIFGGENAVFKSVFDFGNVDKTVIQIPEEASRKVENRQETSKQDNKQPSGQQNEAINNRDHQNNDELYVRTREHNPFIPDNNLSTCSSRPTALNYTQQDLHQLQSSTKQFYFQALLQTFLSKPSHEPKQKKPLPLTYEDRQHIQQQQLTQARDKQSRIEYSHNHKYYQIQPIISHKSSTIMRHRPIYKVSYHCRVSSLEKQEYGESMGEFVGGQIDPFSPATLDTLREFCCNGVCGLVCSFLQSTTIDIVLHTLHMEIVCYVLPLVISQGAQVAYLSLINGLAIGLTISNQHTTIRWDVPLQLQTYNLDTWITINKYNICIKDESKRRKGIRITFRRVELGDGGEEGKRQELLGDWMRRECPGLRLRDVRNWIYDQYLKIVLISI